VLCGEVFFAASAAGNLTAFTDIPLANNAAAAWAAAYGYDCCTCLRIEDDDADGAGN
jgi:hypothetical protein